MADEGPTTVGSINARLTLDGDQFEREARHAEEIADRLDGREVNVHADADTAAARANLAALSAQADDTTRHTNAMGESQRGANNALRGFIAASPLALAGASTIAAGAVGLAAAFGVMAGAGVAAIVGIKHEMEQGTTTGQAYAAGLSSLKVGLDQLEQTGAQHFLDGFATSVSTINRYMPFLNGLVANGADALGNMASELTGGLLQGLEKMSPLIQGGTTALSQFIGWLSSMPATNGFTEFVSYATANLPAVMQLIESLVTLAGRIIAAFAPVGPVVVGVLTGITDVLNALPLPVLAGLVTAAVGMPAAFSIARAAVATFGETAALSALQVTIFGTAINLAVPVVGVLTALLAGLGMAFATAATSQQQSIPVAQEYASALERDGNAIGKYTTQLAVKKLAEEGAYDAVSKLGLGTDVLTKAVTGNADAYKIIHDRIAEVEDKYKTAAVNNRAAGTQMADSLKEQNVAATLLKPALDGNLKAIQDQQHANEQVAAATAGASQADRDKAAAAEQTARVLGVTTPAVEAATKAQQQTADAANNAMLKMQLENDAAGILKGTLDQLNGKALSAAQAQNAFDSSLANMGDHVDKTGKVITFTTTSINDMSAASVALRGQLNSQVANLQQVVEANGGLANSTGKAREQMMTMRQQIIDNAVAHGVDRDAVTAYIDKILQIPASVPPTKIDADTAAAESKIATLRMQMDALTDKVINISVRQSVTGDTGGAHSGGVAMVPQSASGGMVGYLASGGGVAHPWARGTDTEPYMLTRGEFVTRRDSVASIEKAAPGAMAYMNRTGQLVTQPGQMGPVTLVAYIENPFTGEQVRATVKAVAQQAVDDSWADASRRRIGA